VSDLVGIIANPASGKDIRRLIAHGSTFDNNEKINIVRRVLIGLHAAGVRRVRFMPDGYAIVARAAATLAVDLDLAPLPMPVLGAPSDTLEAARRLADLGAGCIVTLGGDGTNRLVAKGCGDIPLVPISTGTNNVFPRMVEGTLAGMAAGLVATRAVPPQRIVGRQPRLDLFLDGELKEIALIDVVTTTRQWVGARAIWNPADLAEIVLSRVDPAQIGMCGIGGALFPEAVGSASGVHAVVGDGSLVLNAALAPGLLRPVPISAASLLHSGERATLGGGPCTVALDGERELELLRSDQSLQVMLNPAGPFVVDIDAALREGARHGCFARSRAEVTPS
jgi:predicted polyphosphate/ATP-dependent NAD kinase